MRLKNDAASWGLLLELVEKSIQAHREWSGSMILFLKLQVKMNLQLPLNSSVNARRRSCTSLVAVSYTHLTLPTNREV